MRFVGNLAMRGAGILVAGWILLGAEAGLAQMPGVQDVLDAPKTAIGKLLAPGTERESGQVAPDSPRASLTRFLDAARKGRWEEASQLLDVPPARNAEQEDLARRLKDVLDQRVWLDLSLVSPLSEGNREDDLPVTVEEVATFNDNGEEASIRLTLRTGTGGKEWVFSRKTVERIDAWHEALDRPWFLDWVPDSLLHSGPLDLRLWQWIAIPLALLLAWMIGWLLGGITRRVLQRLTQRTDATWDDEILERTRGLTNVVWGLVAAYFLLRSLALHAAAERWMTQALSTAVLLSFFWALIKATDIVVHHVVRSEWGTARPASRSIVPLLGRVLKVLIIIIAVIAVLSDLGYPVGSLIAGLGIGGLALALAAQKTVENLFGAFSIGVDQPMRVGDYVDIGGGVQGTVETIGMRSTRIRTMNRTVVSVPNGRLAEMSIESFAARDRIRLWCTIGLEYGTSLASMQEVLKGFEQVIRNHSKAWQDTVIVRFKEFGASSLDIEVMAWFETTDFDVFRVIREEILLGFMQVVERAGTSFAFPTRTVHLVQAGPRAAEGVVETRTRGLSSNSDGRTSAQEE